MKFSTFTEKNTLISLIFPCKFGCMEECPFISLLDIFSLQALQFQTLTSEISRKFHLLHNKLWKIRVYAMWSQSSKHDTIKKILSRSKIHSVPVLEIENQNFAKLMFFDFVENGLTYRNPWYPESILHLWKFQDPKTNLFGHARIYCHKW